MEKKFTSVMVALSALVLAACGNLPDADKKKFVDCKAAEAAGEELSESCKQLLGTITDIVSADIGDDSDSGNQPDSESDIGTDAATADTADSGDSPDAAEVDETDAGLDTEDIADSGDGVDVPDSATEDVGPDAADVDVGEDATETQDGGQDTDTEPDVLPPLCVTATDCDDQNPCTDDTCDPVSGCVNLANTATCTDSNACTVDLCEAATCTATPAVCDDGNACTDDSCDSASGCAALPNNATCTDSDECTTGEVCTKGSCVGGIAKECDDGNVCTDNGCDIAAGCTATVNTALCDDGSKCTEGDTCSAKSCAAGKPVSCDDGNACTQDVCNPATGCGINPVADNTPCGANKACKAGACVDLVPSGMSLIPAGEFWMGCNTQIESNLCMNNPGENPQHQVFTDAVYIDTYEVRVTDYKKCVEAGVCIKTTCSETETGKDNHPVNCVTWGQADTYCKWAGKRLPTEAEWEKAARGCPTCTEKSSPPIFPWGNDYPSCGQVNVKFQNCGAGDTSPVTKFPETSAYGVKGLAGNVSEWVADWNSLTYFSESVGAVNPQGPATGTSRVIRGGNYLSLYESQFRVGFRNGYDPNKYQLNIGFRCAKSVQ